jgi:hypothetical protein
MRSIHTVELFLDSVVYGWLLAVLLLPRKLTRVGDVGMLNYNI